MATGKELKRLRELSGYTAEQFAKLMLVSPDRLRKWMDNDSTPRLEDRIKIENYFGTTLENLPKIKEVPKSSKTKNPRKSPFSVDLSDYDEKKYIDKIEELERIINTQKKTIETQQKTIDSQEELISIYRRTAADRPNSKQAS